MVEVRLVTGGWFEVPGFKTLDALGENLNSQPWGPQTIAFLRVRSSENPDGSARYREHRVRVQDITEMRETF